MKHLLHINKSPVWFSINMAMILLGPNASGEGKEQVAAFKGESGPPHAADCQEESLPELPWTTSTEPWEEMVDRDRGFCSI